MRRRFALVVVAAALLSPIGLRGGSSAQAMTCATDPPFDTACDVVFGVFWTVCNGQPPKLPSLPITTTVAIRWPVYCPPLG